jgi:hypothetical protein
MAAPARAPFIERPALARALVDRAREGPPIVVTGPPGAGKTTLLLQTAKALEAEGWAVVFLDLMGAASSPERFVSAALGALPARAFGARLPQATAIRRLADQGKAGGAAAVEALLALWSSLDEAAGQPVALLLDEVTEIKSLSYFAGLRDVDRPFAAALSRRRRGTVLATSYPTAARKLWTSFETLAVAPLSAAELAPLAHRTAILGGGEALARGCFGWPRYLHALWVRVERGEPVASAWAAEMAAGGGLEQCARHTYETLLLRSRGYGMSKAVLAVVAEEEGSNLTALVARVGRTPGAVRDYLGWLVGVDALRMVRKRYFYVDGMVRWWVRLHGRGIPASSQDLEKAARQIFSEGEGVLEPAAFSTTGSLAVVEPAVAVRSDTLMEID